jgi:hypothetical protein
MMQEDDEPIDREAWRRMLTRDTGEPPRATDERIRAEARRALAPHTGRWWLPASLAASLLLAVVIVQWQYDAIRSPVPVTESDVARPSAPAPTSPAAPQAASPAESAAVEPAPADAAGKEAPAELRLHEMEAPREPAGRAAAVPAQDAAAPAVTGLGQIGELHSREKAAAKPRTPEQWYAEIEALRAAGRHAEADAELARLEEAYPGWLEEHVPEDR